MVALSGRLGFNLKKKKNLLKKWIALRILAHWKTTYHCMASWSALAEPFKKEVAGADWTTQDSLLLNMRIFSSWRSSLPLIFTVWRARDCVLLRGASLSTSHGCVCVLWWLSEDSDLSTTDNTGFSEWNPFYLESFRAAATEPFANQVFWQPILWLIQWPINKPALLNTQAKNNININISVFACSL